MELGKRQGLKVESIRSIGAILEGKILLPKNECPENIQVGQSIDVYLYTDSEDRLIATTKAVKIDLGGLALLEVVDTAKIGAFLDWGLPKDLFLPRNEMVGKIKKDDLVLVACYMDKEGRLAATMKVNPYFKPAKHLKENDQVQAVVYAKNRDYGSFCLVEGQFNGLIPTDKTEGILQVGEEVTCRVTHVKEDGKVDLSMKTRAYQRLDEDARRIYQTLSANHGFLRVNDKSSPADIKLLFGLSKAQFKRSVGRLLKTGAVHFQDDGLAIDPTKDHHNHR